MAQGELPRLKILQLAAPATAGGLERVVETLAIGHHRRGHQVTVALVLPRGSDSSHPVVRTLRSAGVQVQELRMASRAYFRERRTVAALCRSLLPDVVHTHGYRTDILDRPVAAKLGIPTVTTVHGPSKMGGLKGVFFEWLQRRNYRRFDAVVAVSRHLFDITDDGGVPDDRLHCIPNAWGGHHEPLPRSEARRRLSLSPDDLVVGWVGRMIPVKGADVFLRALSRLSGRLPVSVMIGYGQEMDRLRGLAKELGIEASVHFHDEIPDAGRYFAAFDTYVLSSRSEGLPIVILEAMAAGTPIVATRVGGVPDALSGAEGWLVHPDDPEALAAAISDSLTDRNEAEARAARASTRLRDEYAIDRFLDGYERVYRRVTAGVSA